MQEENEMNDHGVNSRVFQSSHNAGYLRHQGEQFQVVVRPVLKSLRR